MAKTNPRDTVDNSGAQYALFETQRDTLNFAAKLDVSIQSLKADWLGWIVAKWGPMGLGATITDSTKLSDFQADKNRYLPFERWVQVWNKYYAQILTFSWWNPWPDYYRDVENYAKEYNAWRPQFSAATSLKPSAPGVVTPSLLPGVIPGAAPGGVEDKSPPAWLTALQWGVVGVGIYFGGKFLLSYMGERKAALRAAPALPASTGSASGLEPLGDLGASTGCAPCDLDR